VNFLLAAPAHAARWAGAASPLLDLGIRLYMADVFFRSGLVKVRNWSGTLYLFENEYRVPLLPPEAAAWLGTFAELALPLLLALGIASRFAALSLSAVNLVAVISFWHVLSGNEAARMSHFYWGLLLLVTLCHGPGKLSIDHLLGKRLLRSSS
jgi:putative oxidoreductase